MRNNLFGVLMTCPLIDEPSSYPIYNYASCLTFYPSKVVGGPTILLLERVTYVV